MRSVIHEPARRRLAALALATLVMLLCGCSVLGIATKDDLTEADTRRQSDTRDANLRISQLEERTKDSQASLAELSASMDSLNAQFAQAADWIQALDLDDISQQASEASQAAIAIQEQNRAFMTKYLEWLKAQQALLAEQVSMIEAKMNTAAEPTPPEEAPTGSE
jgi:septal ring factor EnvC (AmiA/AmiB activator)